MFRTELKIKKSEKFHINHQNEIFSIGSCFADNILIQLDNLKFNVCRNPFGVLYNPVSILNIFKYLNNEKVLDSGFCTNNGFYYHYDFHGKFCANEKEILKKKLNVQIKKINAKFLKSDRLIITLGTAYVYELKSNSELVANCHKLPAYEFQRRRLSQEQCKNALEQLLKIAKELKPEIKILFTVSPIRHLSDGFHENQLSKASLLLAVEEIIRKYPDIEYFPAYELMMDDLRDYRFYDNNLKSPSSLAIDYILEKFMDFVFDKKHENLLGKIIKINKRLEHNTVNTESEETKMFYQKLLDDMLEIKNEGIFYEKELNELKEKVKL